MLATVPPVKTPLGQQELRRRTAGLGQRHRTLLFLIDGRRPLSEVLVLGHKAGAATSHLEDLIRLGYVDVPALHPPEPMQPVPPPVPDRDVPSVVTYVELEVPAGPLRSQWGSLEADAHIPVPEVKVLEDLPAPDLSDETPAESLTDWVSEPALAMLPEPLPVAEPEPATELAPPAEPASDEFSAAALQQAVDAFVQQQAHRQALVSPVAVEPLVVEAVLEPALVPVAPVPVPLAVQAPEPLRPPVVLRASPPAPAPVVSSPVSAPAPAPSRPVPPILQRMAMLGRRPAARPKEPLEEARENLLRAIKLDRTTVSRRLRPRVVNAKTEGTLIDVVWELERDLTHGQRSHEGLLALQRAREMLQLGNTLVDEEDESGLFAG